MHDVDKNNPGMLLLVCNRYIYIYILMYVYMYMHSYALSLGGAGAGGGEGVLDGLSNVLDVAGVDTCMCVNVCEYVCILLITSANFLLECT